MSHVTFEKPAKGTANAERATRRRGNQTAERREKKKVRIRDRKCRFPRCGCKRMRFTPEVSHRLHKGMGGNPKGDRSVAELMMLLCSWRHRAGKFAIDRGNIWWEALNDELGANGPVVWFEKDGNGARVLAVEISVGVFEPFTEAQKARLRTLATMEE